MANNPVSSGDVTIIAVGMAHVGDIADLADAAFGDDAWAEEELAATLADPATRALAAIDGAGAPIGFAIWRALPDDAELMTIGVTHAARQRGVGRSLLAATISAAMAVGSVRLLLEVAVDNRAALALYFRAGFAEIGRRRRYYRDGRDALVLARPLTGPRTRAGDGSAISTSPADDVG